MNMKCSGVSVYKGGKAPSQDMHLHEIRCHSICPRCGKLFCRPAYVRDRSDVTVPSAVSASAVKPAMPAQPALLAAETSSATNPAPPDRKEKNAGYETVSHPPAPALVEQEASIPLPVSHKEEAGFPPLLISGEETAMERSATKAVTDRAECTGAQVAFQSNLPEIPPHNKSSMESQPQYRHAENTECEPAVNDCPERKQNSSKQEERNPSEEGLYGRGLLYFEQWWKFRFVDVAVRSELLSGVPTFIEKNTLRIINDEYSYFIPLEKVDYIRTNDGLASSFQRKPFF